MDISNNVGSNAAAAGKNMPGSKSLGATNDDVGDFLKFLHESPAERMQDEWLRAHGITKAQFDKMSAAEKQKIIDEMKRDIEAKLKKDMNDKLRKTTDVAI